MISETGKYRILIEYSDFNHNDMRIYFKGMKELEFTGKELYESVITCGMPYFYSTRNISTKRDEEIKYKIHLLKAVLDVDKLGYLIYSDRMQYLDATERAYLNYYLGMFITNLVSSKIFGFEYLVHLSIAKRFMSIKFDSSKQPDLIAFNKKNNNYSIFEAKGRIKLNSGIFKTAKNQVQAIKWISGSSPSNGIVSVVYSNKGFVSCHLKDPEIKAKKNFDILKFHLIWIYYEPIYLYIKESKKKYFMNKNMVEGNDIQIEKNRFLTIGMYTRLYNFYDENNIEIEDLEEIAKGNYKLKYKKIIEEFDTIINESEYLIRINIQ